LWELGTREIPHQPWVGVLAGKKTFRWDRQQRGTTIAKHPSALFTISNNNVHTSSLLFFLFSIIFLDCFYRMFGQGTYNK
jgi:hypothetical protein